VIEFIIGYRRFDQLIRLIDHVAKPEAPLEISAPRQRTAYDFVE